MAETNELSISDLVEIEVKKRLSANARRAGKARLTKMTAEERKRVAELGAEARWGKKIDAPDPKGPKGPKGPKPDQQPSRSIMLNRKPCRQTGIPLTHPTLFEIPEAA
jgi:hypothetical protein